MTPQKIKESISQDNDEIKESCRVYSSQSTFQPGLSFPWRTGVRFFSCVALQAYDTKIIGRPTYSHFVSR